MPEGTDHEMETKEYLFTIEHGNTTTYITLEFIVGVSVCLALLVGFIVLLRIRARQDKDKNAWVSTTAVLTGKNNVYKDSSNGGGYQHVPTENVEYEIEYRVEGKRYVKWLTIVPSEEAGTEIPIEYYKKNPSRFREL